MKLQRKIDWKLRVLRKEEVLMCTLGLELTVRPSSIMICYDDFMRYVSLGKRGENVVRDRS